jgi:hypothetical protein
VGRLLPAVKIRRFLYASLGRHLADSAQLLRVKLTRILREALEFLPEKGVVQGQFSYASCK